MIAAFADHPEIVKTLLANGADINAKDSSGRTALNYVSGQDYNETVHTLLANGATVNKSNDIVTKVNMYDFQTCIHT